MKGGALVTGGLSASGLVLSRELAMKGHSPIVTVSRSGRTAVQSDVLFDLDIIQEYTEHHDIRSDLADSAAMADIFASFNGAMGPVRNPNAQDRDSLVLQDCFAGTTTAAAHYGAADSFDLVARVIDNLERTAADLGDFGLDQLTDVRRIHRSFLASLSRFKDQHKSQPYSQESHMALLHLEDMEARLAQLITQVGDKLKSATPVG